MPDEPERDPETTTDDEALEEIRRLFMRYRRLARHGMVRERDAADAETETEPIAAGR